MPLAFYPPLTITVDGTPHTVTDRELPLEVRTQCRALLGVSPKHVIRTVMTGDVDVDMLAAFVWMARQEAGEQVELADVYESMSDVDRVNVVMKEAEAGPPA